MGETTEAISWATIGWIVFVAVASSALGGYIAGRLRTRWLSVHTDEVYFRDTAHGFLAWAVATLVTASVLTSAVGTILGAGAAAGGAAAAAAGSAAAGGITEGQDPGPPVGMNGSGRINQQSAYTLDSLFRIAPGGGPTTPVTPGTPGTPGTEPTLGTSESLREAKSEIAGIFFNSMDSGKLPADDATYAAQLVAQRTGMSQQDAETRVNEVHAAAYKKIQDARDQARELADEARKHAAYASLWIFISLLSGAFIASLMATFGGRQRDLC
jgi:hypothetical protein